jgi:hypothetical protein
MRLSSARQSIHDAFAIHWGGPADNIGGGGGKWNSTKWLAQAGTAGIIIRSVMNQPVTLRSTAIFLNAPDIAITQENMVHLKSGLWTKFIAANEVAPAHQGVLVAYLDRLMIGYRSRVWNRRSVLHTSGAIFVGYAGRKTLVELANRLLDILQGFDSSSLMPVQGVIDAEKDAEQQEFEAQREKQQRIKARMATGLSWKHAKKAIEAEDARAHEQTA